tara:strand:- start:330 stop:1109 length:780 start_codon:yes stop_codon:yes gene_type:complete
MGYGLYIKLSEKKKEKAMTITRGETYKFKDVLALAYASNRFNKGYIKETETPHDIEGKPIGPVKVANKQIIRYLISEDDYGIPPVAKDVIQKANIQLSDTDNNLANETVEWLEGFAMRVLANDLNGFEQNLYKTFEKEMVTNYDFGLIASIPQTFLKNRKRETLQERIEKNCNGDWVGKQYAKVKLDIELVSGIYSRNFGSYIYVGITNNNQLVTFWSKHDWTKQVNDKIKVSAKVKRNVISKWFNGVKESQLNFVKLL